MFSKTNTRRIAFTFIAVAMFAIAGVEKAYADVCINQDPRKSCFAFGADALLEYEGILEVTDRKTSSRVGAENGRPKVSKWYIVYGKLLRQPSEAEWAQIEKELQARRRRNVCAYAGDPRGPTRSGKFISAGGILEHVVILLSRDSSDGPWKRRTLLDLSIASCFNPDQFKSSTEIEFGATEGEFGSLGLSMGTVEE